MLKIITKKEQQEIEKIKKENERLSYELQEIKEVFEKLKGR